MLPVTRLLRCCLFAGLLLPLQPAWAQVAPSASAALHGYDFLTVTSIESANKSFAKILITPAFHGKSEIQLEAFGGFSGEKNIDRIQQNNALVNQQLTDLTLAGWELVQAYPYASSPGLFTTRYLFRKAKS